MKGPAEIAHGPMFIGFVFNVMLYRVMVTQVYLYFTTFKGDKVWMKCFVFLLLLADTVNTIFDWIYLYDSLITHFDDAVFLSKANWVFATDPAMTGIIASLVQLFFAWRVKVLTTNNWLLGLVVLSALAGGVGGITTAIEVMKTPMFVNFQNFKAVVIVWLAAECVGDIIITASLVTYLRKHKTGFQGSDELIDRIIRMTVQTGMLTAICAIIDLIVFLADPTGTHLIFNFPLSKLYTNSLMSSLNSRKGWNYGITQCSDTIIQRRSAQGSDPAVRMNDLNFSRPEVFIHVESLSATDLDEATVVTEEGPSCPWKDKPADRCIV